MTAPRNNLEQQPESLGYREYAQNARLLRALQRPQVPAELSDRAFLEAIYERAAADRLGTILADALPPRQVPEEHRAGGVWDREARDRPELAAHFRSPVGRRAPGWLWQRIHADLRRLQADRRRQVRAFRLRVAAAAAVLLMVGGGLSMNMLWPGTSTAGGPGLDIQVQTLERPLGQPLHGNDLVRLIAGGGK